MVFNEILIPQDFFTETNVTRKRSVVGNSYLYSKVILFEISCLAFILFFVCFYMSLKNMKDNNKTTCHTKMMHKNKNVRKKDIKIIRTKIRNKTREWTCIELSFCYFSMDFQ